MLSCFEEIGIELRGVGSKQTNNTQWFGEEVGFGESGDWKCGHNSCIIR